MLKGKTALVTGSTSGIGLGIAQALAQQGAHLILNGFGDAASALAQIQALGVKAVHHPADMSKPSEIEAMMAFAQQHGGVDILVNNAGIQHVALVEDFPVDKWDAIIAINLSSAFHASRAVLPAMQKANWGRIINLASIYGVEGTANRSDYVATKHGLVGLTKVVALECAEYHITCNALCPAAVHTPHLKQLITQRAQDAGVSEEALTADFLKARQPSKRFVQPSKVGALAAFLCSDDAGDITGTPIPIDGGWQARA